MTRPHKHHRRLAAKTQDTMSHVFENSTGPKKGTIPNWVKWWTLDHKQTGKIKVHGKHQLWLSCRDTVKIKTTCQTHQRDVVSTRITKMWQWWLNSSRIFTLLNEKPPNGNMWLGRRLTTKSSNYQTWLIVAWYVVWHVESSSEQGKAWMGYRITKAR